MFARTVASGLLAFALALPNAAHAEMTRIEQGLERIELTGSLRMLSQRLVRNSCFVVAGIADEGTFTELAADADEFNRRADLIVHGDESIGMGPERSPIILASFENQIMVPWRMMHLQALATVTRGEAERADVADIFDRSELLLADLNAAVSAYEEKYARGSRMSPEQSRTLNVYARQRMLSQRIAGLPCLASIEVDGTDARTQLEGAYETFAIALADMADGNVESRMMPPPPAAATVIDCARNEFEQVRPLIEDVIAGATLDRDQLTQLLAASRQLTIHSQNAVDALLAYFDGTPFDTTGCGAA